jgi:hypothetical protein
MVQPSSKYEDFAKQVHASMSQEELDGFDYLFNLNMDHLAFGKYDSPNARGSFANFFNTLDAYLALVASKIQASSWEETRVKATAYQLMLTIACLNAIIDKKADYVFPGSVYNWKIGTSNPKYMTLSVTFDMKFGYASFMLWDDKRKLDYIRVSYNFSESDSGVNYISKAYTTQLQKFKVSRFNANSKQKTIVTTLQDLWKNLKSAITVVTEKTII